MIYYYDDINEFLDYFVTSAGCSYRILDIYLSGNSCGGYVYRYFLDDCRVVYLYRRFFIVKLDCKVISAYRFKGGDWCYMNTDDVRVEDFYQGYLSSKYHYNDNKLIIKIGKYSDIPLDFFDEYISTFNYSVSDDGDYEYLLLIHFKGVDFWDLRPYVLKDIGYPNFCVVPYEYLKKIKGLL
jgi:hypothetical protein